MIGTRSAAATKRVAAALAGALAPCPVLLQGPLGAGKTTFTQGFVHALTGGAGLRVQSPTFAFARTYPTAPAVHHLDLYRIEDEESAEALGLDEMMRDGQAFSLVEWADRCPALCASLNPRLEIVFPDNPSASRRLRFRGFGVEVGALEKILRNASANR